MAEILDKLLPDTQQRTMKLQQKYDWLQTEHDILPEEYRQKKEKKLHSFTVKANRKLLKPAFEACDKTQYAACQMEEKLQTEGCIEAMAKNFNTIAIPASDIAIELGNAKCMNVVLFGAMCDSLGCPEIDWEQVVAETVPEKVRELNLKAFRAGREAAKASK